VVTHMSDHFCAWRICEIHVRPTLCKRCQFVELDFLSSIVEDSVAYAAIAAPVVIVQQERAKSSNCQLPGPLPLRLWSGVGAGADSETQGKAVVLVAAFLVILVLIGTALSRDKGSVAIIRMLHLHISWRSLHRAEEQLLLEHRRVLYDSPESRIDPGGHDEVEYREMRQDGFNELVRKA
jgi:hypothetical protein